MYDISYKVFQVDLLVPVSHYMYEQGTLTNQKIKSKWVIWEHIVPATNICVIKFKIFDFMHNLDVRMLVLTEIGKKLEI